jgi:hypothetical protein
MEKHHRDCPHWSLPRQIRFDAPEDLFRYIGRQREYARFQGLVETVCAAQPALRDWIVRRPLKVLEQHVSLHAGVLRPNRHRQARPSPLHGA